MKCYAKKIITASVFCVLSLFSFSQIKDPQDSLVTAKIDELKAVWNLDNYLMKDEKKYEPFNKIPPVYVIKSTDTLSDAEYVKAVNDAQRKILQHSLGLEGVANYLQNFNPGINSEDNLIYKDRFYAGLDWNILNDGFIGNRYKQTILKNQNKIILLTKMIRTFTRWRYQKNTGWHNYSGIGEQRICQSARCCRRRCR